MRNIKSRRQFIGSAAAASAVFTIVPRHVLGGPGYKAPSDTLNVACVGAGGMGGNNVLKVAGMEYDDVNKKVVKVMDGENIVALCDVDSKQTVDLKAKADDRLSLPGKTMTIEDGEEKIILSFGINGKVRLSGSEFGDF